MHQLRTFVRRIRALFQRRQLDAALDEELQFHLEMEAERLVRYGMTPDAARMEARRSFGGVDQVKETYRDRRGLPALETLARDLVDAARTLRRHPGYASAVVLSLALGIGGTTSVVSIADATLLRPLPFRDSDRVVGISQVDPKVPERRVGVTPTQSEGLRSSGVFESVAEYRSYMSEPYTLTRGDGALVVTSAYVSPDFFRVFRVQPARGRAFTVDDEEVERPAACLLTASGVRRLFNGERDIVGRRLPLVEGPMTVVGVMDDRFWYPVSPETTWGRNERDLDLLLPYPRRSTSLGPESVHTVAARLKPGTDLAQAQRVADEVARRYPATFPDGSMLNRMRVRPLQQELTGNARSTLLTLVGVAGCLLLICCVNVANVLLSRSQSRAHELALRTSLGAGRPRLFRQLLTEHLVLAAIGGFVGLSLTAVGMGTFVGLLPRGLLLLPEIDLDARVLGIAALVTLVAGVLAGLGPALAATRADLMSALKEGSRMGSRTARWRSFASVLLVVEAAVLLVLLSGGALLVNTLVRLRMIDLGFAPDRLWVLEVDAPPMLYPEDAQIGALAARITDALRRIPGVVSVGDSDWGPLRGFCEEGEMTIDGRAGIMRPEIRHVSADYFTTLNMALGRGRFWTPQDENVKPQVAVINSTAAQRYWPNEDPIGRRIVVNENWPVRVIGVVRDMREADERQAPGPSVYLPLNPFSSPFYRGHAMVLRTSRAETRLARDAVRAVAAIDPRLPISVVRADQTLSQRRQDPRFYAVFVGMVAAFGLLLAGVGIAGVTAQGVARRTREIGVRLALGAQVTGVICMVVRQVCAPVGVGVALGVAGALALSRVLTSLLYEVTPQDPLTHIVAVVLLVAIALAAAWLPARRAATINPVDTLRAE